MDWLENQSGVQNNVIHCRGLQDNYIHVMVSSGNYHTLAARQHKHFFCNVYFIETIFFYGCYGPFYSPDFI